MRWLLVLMMVVAGCEKAPEGGWGPVSDGYSADGLGKADVSRQRVTPEGQQLRVRLADGEEVTLALPDAAGAGLSLDGVGPYPGARFGEVLVRVPQPGRTDGARLILELSFEAPAPPEQVADWMQARTLAQGRDVQREGLVLNGQTRAGDDWTLVLAPVEAGSRGELRLRRR
jgi:hypothetical protein